MKRLISILFGIAGIALMSWTVPGQAQTMSSVDADNWYNDGVFPAKVTIQIGHPTERSRLLLPFPGLVLKSGSNWPECRASGFNRPVGESGYWTGFSIGNRLNIDHPWYNGPNQLQFGVEEGVVFPLHEGMVYRVAFDDVYMSLVRVTDALPESIRPLPTSRCLAANCLNAVLSSHRMDSSKFMNPIVGMRAEELSFDKQDAQVAKIRWVRHTWAGRQVLTSELKEYFSLFLLPDKIERTVRAGDVIDTNVYSFQVRKVVPPQKIDGAGSLTGWIELQRRHPS